MTEKEENWNSDRLNKEFRKLNFTEYKTEVKKRKGNAKANEYLLGKRIFVYVKKIDSNPLVIHPNCEKIREDIQAIEGLRINWGKTTASTAYSDFPIRGVRKTQCGYAGNINSIDALKQLIKLLVFKESDILSDKIANNASGGVDELNSMEGIDEAGGTDPIDDADARKIILRSIVRRRGQQKFRSELLDAYNGTCVISGCNVVEALEAAHISPYLGDHTNIIKNGILLRADLHTLFDLRLIKIHAKTKRIWINANLKGTIYGDFEEKEILKPKNKNQEPDVKALQKHFVEEKLR